MVMPFDCIYNPTTNWHLPRLKSEKHLQNTSLILNRLNGQMPAPLQARIDEMDIPLLGVVPADEELIEFEFNGRPLVDLGEESPVYLAVAKMMDKILQ